MGALLIAFSIVLVAEMGDKTQLVSLALAMRGRALRVLFGVLLGAAAVNLISVGLGNVFGRIVPLPYVHLFAGVLFLIFGLLYLGGTREKESGTGRYGHSANPLEVAAMFFVAEIGDKTMLTTAALSAQYNPVSVWIGSTAALTVSAAVVVGLGNYFGKRLPVRTIRLAAASLFIAFGLLTLAQALTALV